MSSPITTISTKYNTIPSDLDSLTLPNNPKIIGYDSKKFWAEFYLLCRVIYRSRNQHRASFSFQHLKEIKRVVERIGKLELWLKVNYTEKGKGLFDFIGFLNTLMLLIEKAMEACTKTFYFYTHYLEQGLFVTLSLVVIGSISVMHRELTQWKKYVRLLYSSFMAKLNSQNEANLVTEWCRMHCLSSQLSVETSTPQPLAFDKTKVKDVQSLPKNPVSSPKPASSKHDKSKSFKKVKRSNNDEIDDIFNSL